jgi:hypothetical protein
MVPKAAQCNTSTIAANTHDIAEGNARLDCISPFALMTSMLPMPHQESYGRICIKQQLRPKATRELSPGRPLTGGRSVPVLNVGFQRSCRLPLHYGEFGPILR